MPNEITVLTRVQHKHDTEQKWNSASSFVPLNGEIVFYDADDTYPFARMKVGDGVSSIAELPFTIAKSSATRFGLVKLVSDTKQTVAANSPSATASRTYPVQLDSQERLVVNVPWTDNNTNTAHNHSAGAGLSISGSGGTSGTTTYSLKQSTSSEIGGIKIGYTESGKNYPVELNSTGQAYVNVPWTDTNTTYSAATSSAYGLVKIGYAESGKNYPVELNSNGQMFVNVPWTDTNTTYSIATASTAGLVKPISVISKPTLQSVTTTSGRYYSVQMSSDGNMFVNVPWTDTDTNTTYTVTTSGSGNAVTALSLSGTTITATRGSSFILASQKGVAGGVAELDSSGKVPSSQLPSYVDDVLEYKGIAEFPETGETGKIYVDTLTNMTYRWGGSSYVVISSSLALGETSSTAYRGDRGKVAYDHSQSNHNTWRNITVGSTTLTAAAVADTLTFAAGSNVSLSASGETVTIAATDTNTAHTHTVGTGLSISGSGGTSGAVSYSLKVASSTEIGGIRLGYAENGKNYPVELDDENKAYVNVPWTDNNTTYSSGTGISISGTTINHSNSITASNGGPTSNATLTFGGTFTVPYFTYDAQGHITGRTNRTMTMPANPNTDTHYTAYLYAGAQNASANGNATNPYLTLRENNTARSSIRFRGSGYTDISSSGGVITISTTDIDDGDIA